MKILRKRKKIRLDYLKIIFYKKVPLLYKNESIYYEEG